MNCPCNLTVHRPRKTTYPINGSPRLAGATVGRGRYWDGARYRSANSARHKPLPALQTSTLVPLQGLRALLYGRYGRYGILGC